MRSTHPLDERNLALVPVRDASCYTQSFVERIPAPIACGVGAAGLVGFAWLLAVLPVSSFWAIGGVLVALVAVGSIPWPRSGSWVIDPNAIADREVATTYRELLAAHAELAATLEHDASAWAKALVDHSRDVVVSCGRVASTTNDAHRYLALHDPEAVVVDEARLRQRATDTSDAETARVFVSAADTRSRQLASLNEIRHLRDRTLARLKLATASLHAWTGIIAKSQTIDDESLALADASVMRHVEALDDEMNALAAATAVCAT